MKSKPKQKKSEKQTISEFNKKFNGEVGSGKGDGPRNIFSEEYRENYDNIFRKNSNDKKIIRRKEKS
ncbi:MAG: hypothetical protein CME70_18620 [Halobacteriovorax sp.]|nr:hypothetical protein [Halobacteriovorax sp.]|tara:strand:+ start:4736 stop:4936 length:201 start_codon:yes stop_codon:yes gene_type:complete